MIKCRIGYYDNYERTWGDAITFLKAHHNMDFKQAVHFLLEHNGHRHEQPKPKPPRVFLPPQKTKPPAEFTLPEANTNHRRVFVYLIKRGISLDVIADFIQRDLLYESADYHNAVFVVCNSNASR